MFASTCLTEEGVKEEATSTAPTLSPQWSCHLTSGHLDGCHVPAVALPAGIAGLATSLANVDGDALTHGCCFAAAEWKALKKRGGCCFLRQDP